MEKTINRINVEQRCAIYGLLAEVFITEPSKDLLVKVKESGLMEILSGNGSNELDNNFQGNIDELTQELACEYSRLFIGPGKHISPHESVHHELDGGDWGKLWGKSTVDVQKFIESAGMNYSDNFTGLPDHISIEFEFMKQLTLQEQEARDNNDREKIEYFVNIQKKFLKEHIGNWIPDFCTKVMSAAEHDFYNRIAFLTKEFIEFECEHTD